MTYCEFIDSIAATVRGYDGRADLANAVFDAVCGADQDAIAENVDYSDDWQHSGESNNWWTAQNAPDFYDPQSLGDWEGLNLSGIQALCQTVMNKIIDRDGDPA